MVIFHGYLSLPEGMFIGCLFVCVCVMADPQTEKTLWIQDASNMQKVVSWPTYHHIFVFYMLYSMGEFTMRLLEDHVKDANLDTLKLKHILVAGYLFHKL